MTDSDKDNSRDVLVGRLIRSYREGRELTQGGLLDLMVERGEHHEANRDPSSVSRYETGDRSAPREFLVALGRALGTSEREVDRVLVLAGYDTLSGDDGRTLIDRFQSNLEDLQRDVQGIRDSDVTPELQSIRAGLEILQRDVQSLIDSAAAPEPPMDVASALRDAMLKLALPGIYVVGVGYILSALGFNDSYVLLAYVAIALAVVLGQGLSRWRRSDEVGELFFTSMFFTLSTPMLLGAITKIDHYGFYTIPAFTNTSIPFLLAMMSNLALSLAASVIFSVSWNRQYGAKGARSVFSRAVWTALPPILFVYANILVFTNTGGWIYFMIVFGILFGAFTAIIALRDRECQLDDPEWMMKAAVVVTALLCSFGVIGTLAAYVEPSMAAASAEYRLMPWREVSPEELGYTADEGIERLRLGILWMSLSAIAYLATMVGGYLVVTIRRYRNQSVSTPNTAYTRL